MKKFLWILVLVMALQMPGFAAQTSEKAIQTLLENQIKFSNKYDFENISKLYASEFINADGFDRNVYFKLIKETWKSYPQITYGAQIKDITANERYAQAQVCETASAVILDPGGLGTAELFSQANTIYHFEKTGDNWLITAEQLVDEKSFLRYGEARFIKMDLNAPALMEAGKPYTATLFIDAPQNSVVIASISRAAITYPQNKPEDVFRRMNEDNVLERMFTTNKDNLNEYAVASIGIAMPPAPQQKNKRSAKANKGSGGMAVIMTRVNVVPANKSAVNGEADEK